MEELTTLPPVAKTVYQQCKKCGLEKSHLVLAHKSATTASIECTTCKSKKTLRLAGEKKASAPKAPRAPRAPKNDAPQMWEALNKKYGSQKAIPYAMSANFSLNDAIDHTTYGIGFVAKVTDFRIEVVFLDAIKVLVQNQPQA